MEIKTASKFEMLLNLLQKIDGPSTAIIVDRELLELYIRALESWVHEAPTAQQGEQSLDQLSGLRAMRKACGWEQDHE